MARAVSRVNGPESVREGARWSSEGQALGLVAVGTAPDSVAVLPFHFYVSQRVSARKGGLPGPRARTTALYAGGALPCGASRRAGVSRTSGHHRRPGRGPVRLPPPTPTRLGGGGHRGQRA